MPQTTTLAAAALAAENRIADNPAADGYRGIWFTLGQRGEHGDKYSGGLGTYTANHRPLAVYSKAAQKTFFTYGGTRPGERHLLIMASYYDHVTGTVPRPVIVHDKGGVDDPHDNASIALAADGHVWIFVSGRGRKRPGLIFRATEPASVRAFEQIWTGEMTYPQPHVLPDGSFLLMHTKYTNGRELYWRTSPDGRNWSDDRKLAGIGGHYQVSSARQGRIATAFNRHPGGNVDKRTDLYYAETRDKGATWFAVDGTPLSLPLAETAGPALVRDTSAEGKLLYLIDLNFDSDGNPVVLYLTSSNHMPGPQRDPRTWFIAHWHGGAWKHHEITVSTHNYDTGSLYIEGGLWRVLAPTDPGPQPLGQGGEIVLWESEDAGATWRRIRTVTQRSEFNHGYVRRPLHARPDFYGFWADGNPDAFSPSRLYFTDHAGEKVWRLPYDMPEVMGAPDLLLPPR